MSRYSPFRRFKRQLSSIEWCYTLYLAHTYVCMCIIKCQSNIRLALSHHARIKQYSWVSVMAKYWHGCACFTWPISHLCNSYIVIYTDAYQYHLQPFIIHLARCAVWVTNKISLTFQRLHMYCTYTWDASLLWCNGGGLRNNSDGANADWSWMWTISWVTRTNSLCRYLPFTIRV